VELTLFAPFLTVLVGLGSSLALYFTVTFRPIKRLTLATLDAFLWVVVVGLLLVVIGVRYVLGQVRPPKSWWEGGLLLACLGLVDLALLVRVIHWWKVCRAARVAEQHPYGGLERRVPSGHEPPGTDRS
jgi:hypothetical protein